MSRRAVLVAGACLVLAAIAGGIYFVGRHRPPGPTHSGAVENAGLHPWTSSRPVTPQDLQGLSKRQLDVMRNEIYARRGWIFQTASWNEYFAVQPWYHPAALSGSVAATDAKIAGQLSPLESANAAAILAYEKSLAPPAPVIFTRDGRVFSVAADGSYPVQLTRAGYYVISDYVPDQGKVLGIRYPKANQGYPGGDVVGIDVRTARQTLILPATASGVLPDGSRPGFDVALLSPNGRKLIVGEPNFAVPGDALYAALSDGSNLSPKPLARLVSGVTFNPAGGGLAFENQRSDVGPVTIYDLPWQGSPVPLLPLSGQGLWAGSYAWRPDGKAIAFAGSTGNMAGPAQAENNGVYLVTTGGAVTELYPLPPVQVHDLHWLGAHRLSFVTVPAAGNPAASGLATVYTYDIQTGKSEAVISFPTIKWRTESVAWNPDNTAFVFSRDGNLWLKDLSSGQEKQLPGTQGAGDFAW